LSRLQACKLADLTKNKNKIFIFPDPRSIVLWQADFSGWTFQRHFQHNGSGISCCPV